jgi:precorrin-2 dehydrogenase / sirohydrochlorin ferrochelatase
LESFCPLHIDLKARECLVIGGGAVAERKVKVMLSYKARVTVVSPQLNPALDDLFKKKKITYLADIFRPAYLKDIFLAICATDSEAVNRQAAADCIARGILVNTVSEPENCTFFLPAILKNGPLTIAVSTAGSSPALARRIRDQLSADFGPQYGAFATLLQAIRPKIMARIKDQSKRKALFNYLSGEEFFALVKERSAAQVDQLVEELISAEEGLDCEQ